jgi:hypothetical protein
MDYELRLQTEEKYREDEEELENEILKIMREGWNYSYYDALEHLTENNGNINRMDIVFSFYLFIYKNAQTKRRRN